MFFQPPSSFKVTKMIKSDNQPRKLKSRQKLHIKEYGECCKPKGSYNITGEKLKKTASKTDTLRSKIFILQ